MHLIAKNICIDRGGRRIVQSASFFMGPGDALILRGSNGSGKSTLLRALAGLLPFAEGTLVCGNDAADPVSVMHYTGHADGLKSVLSAEENLAFWSDFLRSSLSGVANTNITGTSIPSPKTALAMLGIGHTGSLPVSYLSAGQRRRVALARMLVAPRPVWLLDEPTTALDAGAQKILADLMRIHRAGGGLVIAATHTPLGLDDAPALRLGDDEYAPMSFTPVNSASSQALSR